MANAWDKRQVGIQSMWDERYRILPEDYLSDVGLARKNERIEAEKALKNDPEILWGIIHAQSRVIGVMEGGKERYFDPFDNYYHNDKYAFRSYQNALESAQNELKTAKNRLKLPKNTEKGG